MKRNRLLVLSSVALIASGALMFACSGGDDDSDSGSDAAKTDAKADQSVTDAKADSTTADGGADTGNDATVNDAPNDTTLSDAAEDADADTDADDGSTVTDGSSDAITDASSDGGTVVTFMVLRVGGDVDAGADAALSNGATQTYLEERSAVDGSLVRIIALPIAADDAGNEPFAVQGNSTAEGSLTRSADTHYVVIGGYATAPGPFDGGVAKTATDAGVPRVVARVDKNGNIDTTTQLFAFNKVNIRGAASNDGTAFWASGAGNSSEGTQYVTLGSTGATTNLDTTLTNQRVVQIFGGQVYISSASTPYRGVSTLGTGMPTTAGQTVTLLPGMPGDAGSAYGFSMLDLDGSVSGLDTLYIADDGVSSATPGILKYVFDGNTWTKIATFTDKTTTGFRGLTAYFDGTNIVVLGTTGDSTNPNTVVKYVDDGVNTTPTGTILATAPTNCAFRGIALSPQ